MKFIIVYARLYGDCLKKTGQSLAHAPWIVLLPLVLTFVGGMVMALTARLLGGGIIGGIASSLELDAILSCYLYFLGLQVERAPVVTEDLGRSFGRFFWSIVSVFFVFYIAQLVLTPLLGAMPNGGVILLGLSLVTVLACNAVPEVIYQKGMYGGLATLGASVKFLQENLLEWGLPNLALAALFYAFSRLPMPVLFLPVVGVLMVSTLVGSVLLHVAMVFRGHLFAALDGTSHRQRMFKFRNAA